MVPRFPPVLLYHVKIMVASAGGALLFTALRGEQPVGGLFLTCFLLLCIQLELFLWMAPHLLKIKTLRAKRDFIRVSIVRLIIFYVLVLFITVLTTFSGLTAFFLIHGDNLLSHLSYLASHELKGLFKFYALGLLLSTVSYFYVQWKMALQREQQSEKEKLQFRFEMLKNQVNPHFLFNSLNTLSSLLAINPEMAELFIQKFSAIYHYILEHREVEFIDLTLEIEFVRDYFYLQQIRDGNKINLSIEIADPQKYKIYPISLQLLVENALKHNIATDEKQLKIWIYAENDCLVVKNNLQRKNILEHSKKIGLNNLRERIKYSINKEMKVIETREEFKVIIPLIC